MLSTMHLMGNRYNMKIQTTEHFVKNLGAEANHEGECYWRHLEIWRENGTSHVIRVPSISNQS